MEHSPPSIYQIVRENEGGSAPLLQQEELKNNDKNTASFEFDEEESSIISANKNLSTRKIGEKSTFFQQSRLKKQGEPAPKQSSINIPHSGPLSDS